jgi:hypothetical protein
MCADGPMFILQLYVLIRFRSIKAILFCERWPSLGLGPE